MPLVRRGALAGDWIVPDETVPGPPPGWPSAVDAATRAATAWLSSRPACQR